MLTGLLSLVNQQNNPDAPDVAQPDNAELEAAVLKKQVPIRVNRLG